MTAARLFAREFSAKNLCRIYEEKVRFRASVGMDNISPKAFEDSAENSADLISKKVLEGSYKFTRYREVLINKGRNKPPRVISIPTVRDKVALAAYHEFLKKIFIDQVDESLLHTIVAEISECVYSGRYNAFVKADIEKFYGTINHDLLLKKVRRKIRKKEAIFFLERAIKTPTISRGKSARECHNCSVGVPEGLSISNILANIYLSNLPPEIYTVFNDIKVFRYVDDILILCDAQQAEAIRNWLVRHLKKEYKLSVNTEKTYWGELRQGVPFLGYVFSDNVIGIRPEAKERLENTLETLFRERTKKRDPLPEVLFVWKLNLRIAGCILEGKKYGWMFYYSQMTDLKVLFHLDWLVSRFFHRFGLKKPAEIKRFVRTYHEITKNLNQSTYLINVDRYSNDEKRRTLLSIYGNRSVETLDDKVVDQLFRGMMFREIQSLEHDIQSFS